MLSELDVMRSLQPHPHVVRLIGCCIKRGTGLLISCFIFTGSIRTLRTFDYVVIRLSKWRALLCFSREIKLFELLLFDR